jgi:hypothetical protein
MVATTETRTGNTETRTEKGVSLARGPALILGTILLAAGLYSLYRQHFFPPFSNFPNGNAPVPGKIFGVFGANGWTGMFTAVCGGLLLFGAAQHMLAKTMSLIVGCALGAAAIIGLISGNVLGMASANGWTELAWGIAAAILLLNSLIPRRRRTVAAEEPGAVGYRRRGAVPAAGAGAAAGAAGGAAYERRVTRERVAGDRAVERDQTVADERMATGEPTLADERTAAGEPTVAEERPVADERTVADEPTVADERTAADEPTVTHERMVADRDAETRRLEGESPAVADRGAETRRLEGGPPPATDYEVETRSGAD